MIKMLPPVKLRRDVLTMGSMYHVVSRCQGFRLLVIGPRGYIRRIVWT